LKKKRLNTANLSELQRLEQGEAPTPNSGRIEDLLKYMNTVSRMLGIGAKPMKLWLEICGKYFF